MPNLTYAPPPPWYRRRVHRFFQLTLFLLAILAISFLLPWSYTRLRIAYWFSTCNAYALPPTTVVYESDPTRAKALLVSSPQYLRGDAGYDRALAHDFASFLPDPWKNLDLLLDGPSSPPHWRSWPPILFCHALTSLDGHRPLVILQYDGHRLYYPSNATVYAFQVTLIPPTTLSKPTPQTLPLDTDPALTDASEPITRIYAAQPDPTDPSRLSLDYETPTSRHTLHFQLSHDASKLTLTP